MNDKYKRGFGFILFKKILKIIILITGCIFFLLCPSSMVFGEPLEDISWLSLETKHAIIRYQSFEDLKKFNRKVSYYPEGLSLKQLVARLEPGELKNKITNKVDAIYERVQEILDMRKKTKKVLINIYPHKNQLHLSLKKIYAISFSTYGAFSSPRAWYIYEQNTIYFNVNDLDEGMFAHEMAHAIIDNYLLTRPPKATAEILAKHVDSNLVK